MSLQQVSLGRLGCYISSMGLPYRCLLLFWHRFKYFLGPENNGTPHDADIRHQILEQLTSILLDWPNGAYATAPLSNFPLNRNTEPESQARLYPSGILRWHPHAWSAVAFRQGFIQSI